MAINSSKTSKKMTKYLFAFLVLLTFSCSEAIEIEGFDKEIWVNDIDGCQEQRKALIGTLVNNKDKLLGKDQTQIKELLGNPDRHELYRRTQRFLIYSIDPGSSCPTFIADKTLGNLTIRFNALGRVHEVFYYR